MTFSDLLNDISKLTGMELQSIRPGATITVLDVDTEKGCLLLKTKQGQTSKRVADDLERTKSEARCSCGRCVTRLWGKSQPAGNDLGKFALY